MTWRHEWKHEINISDLIQLRHRLQTVMETDSHAVDGKYEIRSLYFFPKRLVSGCIKIQTADQIFPVYRMGVGLGHGPQALAERQQIQI